MKEVVEPELVKGMILKTIDGAVPSEKENSLTVRQGEIDELRNIQTMGEVERARRVLVNWAVVVKGGDEFVNVDKDNVAEVRRLLSSDIESDFNAEALVLNEARRQFERKLFRSRLFASDTRDAAFLVIEVSLGVGEKEIKLEGAKVTGLSDEAISGLPLLDCKDTIQGYKLYRMVKGGRVSYQRFVEDKY